MDSDKALGALILTGVVVAGVLYFGSLALPWWSFQTAVEIVVSLGFLIILSLGGWIGWTMASTPSPEPIEDLDLEDEEFEDIDFEENEDSEEGKDE